MPASAEEKKTTEAQRIQRCSDRERNHFGTSVTRTGLRPCRNSRVFVGSKIGPSTEEEDENENNGEGGWAAEIENTLLGEWNAHDILLPKGWHPSGMHFVLRG